MSARKIHKLKMSDEFKTCPECGYRDGFHSALRKQGSETLWLFVCPSCDAVFDIGFTVTGGTPNRTSCC